MPRDIKATKSSADPSQYKLGKTSAARLAALTDLPAEKLTGQSLADLSRLYPWQIDPTLLFFRKVCGRVVKTDPVSGIDYPVPFATVQVEDTDCSFLGFFPVEAPWSWFFPIFCHREVIATTQTDACGNFCVWVPRFDIDHVLRFRLERRCFPILFERPDLSDIIRHVIPDPEPGPDPAPFDRGALLARVSERFGSAVAAKVQKLQVPAAFGTSSADIDAALAAPALLDHVAPPLPAELRALPAPKPTRSAKAQEVHPAAATLAQQLAVNVEDLRGLDLRRYIGPFKRCYDVLVPVWAPIIDVPDITFRVLQDTNGDGVEEQIYGEGYFQVRWNAGTIPPVTLHAGPNAQASRLPCDLPPVPCGNEPAIVLAGRLAVTGDPATYDNAAGYAVRTNRPHPAGTYQDPLRSPAQSPLRDVLSLFGCNRTDPKATHYRLVYRYSADHGATFTAPAPFTGLTWPLFRLNGMGIGEYHYPVESGGWYPIALPPGPNAWLPQDLLLDWPSYNFADGLYSIVVELGDGTTASSQSEPVAINVDNSRPTATLTVETSTSPIGPWTPIDSICPVVRRGVIPHDMYFRVTLTGVAQHLRSLNLVGSGCGGGNFTPVSDSGGAFFGGVYWHWHDSPGDNSQTLQVVYKLAAGALQGTYSFGGAVSSRSFSPSGYDGGHLVVPPWQYDPDHAPIYPSVAFSVFNAD